jgi:hypothetical protein
VTTSDHFGQSGQLTTSDHFSQCGQLATMHAGATLYMHVVIWPLLTTLVTVVN